MQASSGDFTKVEMNAIRTNTKELVRTNTKQLVF